MNVVEWSIGSTMKGIVLSPTATGINLTGTGPILTCWGMARFRAQVAANTVRLIKYPGMATDASVCHTRASKPYTKHVHVTRQLSWTYCR